MHLHQGGQGRVSGSAGSWSPVLCRPWQPSAAFHLDKHTLLPSRNYCLVYTHAVLISWRQAAEAPAKERKRTRDKSKERTEKAPKEKRSRHHRDRGAVC